jgi:hypothetical protein
MTKKIGVFLSAAAFTVFAATAAEAQVSMGVGGGPAFAGGDQSGTGWHAQLSLGMGMPMLPVGLRVDGLWAQWPGDGATDRMLGGTANAELAFPGVLFSPYFLGGVGLYNTRIQHGHATPDEDTGIGFNAGLGARFGFGGLAAFAETRVHFVNTDHAGSVQMIPLTFGIRF